MNINTREVTPKIGLEMMKDTLAIHQASNFNIPFFLHGQPGVGKSQMVQQLADHADMALKVQMLTQIEATDLRGLQFIDDETKKTVNYPPSWLPGPDDKPTIIFLDELPSAEPRLQVSGYQLLLEGRIGEYVLDRKHYVCAAGNRVSDGAVVYEMGTALADRLQHMVIVPEPRSWLDWASDANIHPTVMTFIQLKGHFLEKLEEQIQKDFLIGPSPRSWERVSAIMTHFGDNEEKAYPLVEGWLGTETTADFFLTAKEMKGLPDPARILEMDEKEFASHIPNKLHNLWGLAFALVSYANTTERMGKACQFFGVMVEKCPDNTLPVEDVRKMGMEMLLEKADKRGKMMELLEVDAVSKYMDDSEEVIAIGDQ